MGAAACAGSTDIPQTGSRATPPIQSRPVVPDAYAKIDSTVTSGSAPTVLVVDDDEDLLVVLRDVIDEEGYRVLTARGGEAALALLESGETPCMILLDLKMPGMDGAEFRKRQLADPRLAAIPVVGFTGLWNGEESAHRLALASCLRKPVNLHKLLETVAHYCSDPDHLDVTPPASATG
jgi:CheY-like chemotaxis protein